VGEVIPFLFTPSQDSRLIEQSALLRFFLINLLPLRRARLSGSISPASSRHSILQDPGRMPEQALVLGPLCASIETYLGLMNCRIPREHERI